MKKNERFSTSIETVLDKKEVKLEMQITEKPKAEVKPQQEFQMSATMTTTIPRVSSNVNIESKSIEIPSIVAEKKAMLGEILHIEEDTPTSVTNNSNNSAAGSSSCCNKDILTTPCSTSKEIHKSPIPARNTQKYVSQFADLKLTGGCLSQADSTFTTNTQTTTTSGIGTTSSNNKIIEQTPQLTSFKPQVKVKPQFFKKPFSRPPTTPEMTRRGSGTGSSQD